MKFIASFLLSLLIWFPVVIVGLPVTFFLLQPRWGWDGKTTWFGNYLYGRAGNNHMPPNPTLFDQWWFLAIRNPAGNFGTQVLSVKEGSLKVLGGPWLVDKHILGRFYWLYGWKNPVEGLRTFVCRPWFHD
jgi:hypothetical protein